MKGIKNFYNGVKNFAYPLVFLLALQSACAFKPAIRPNYLKGKETLLQTILTKEEAEKLKINFKQNPAQYSQQMADHTFTKINQKNPEIAKELAEIPELNDGINTSEAKAVNSIYHLIKNAKIPPNIFKEKKTDKDTLELILEWQGNSNEKSDWSGAIYVSSNFTKIDGKILNAQPIGLEKEEDQIDYKKLKQNGDLIWKSTSNKKDTDGLLITLDIPTYKKINLHINGQLLNFTPAEVLSKNQITFNEKKGLEGKLTIKNANSTNLTPETFALKYIILAGKGDYKFSAPLQALLWAYMDGKLKEGDNPLKNYPGNLEFTKKIWGDMEGKRWENFEEVTSRLNLPELIDHYIKKKFHYDFYIGDKQSDERTFELKSGNCYDTSDFIVYCLTKAGYKADLLWVDSSIPEGHIIVNFEDKDKEFIMDNGTPFPKGILGPYKPLWEIPYTIRGPLLFLKN